MSKGKPNKKTVSYCLPPKLLNKLTLLARERDMSHSEFVGFLLWKATEEIESKNQKKT